MFNLKEKILIYKGNKILITGGLGFLGSSLANKLILDGAEIYIIDNQNPLYGGNLFNVKDIQNDIHIIIEDMRNEDVLLPIIKKVDVIFHFAAQVSYIDSLSIPFEDMDLNAKSTLCLLEICRKYNPKVKIVFSSSRMVLGHIDRPKFDEQCPTNPLSLYGIHKLTSEKYLLMYYKDFGISSIIFRITNPYGPRQQIKHSKYSLPGWFVRQAMEDKTIKVFGTGEQIRDYIFIDDIIEGIYSASHRKEAVGQIINIGSGKPNRFKDMVTTIVDVVGKGKIEYVPWPENYENIETGDSIADISKLIKISSFAAKTSLKEGVEKTFEYYKKYKEHYV